MLTVEPLSWTLTPGMTQLVSFPSVGWTYTNYLPYPIRLELPLAAKDEESFYTVFPIH